MTDSITTMPVARDPENPLEPPVEYRHLQEEKPIHWVRFPNGTEGWLVTRYDEGSEVFADPRMSARRPRHDTPPDENQEENPSGSAEDQNGLPPLFVMMDEPDHGMFRRVLSGKFTPKAVRKTLQPYIDRIVDEHLDAIAQLPQPVDLVEALCLPVPCLVICEILGVPNEDRDDFHHATETLMDVSHSQEERNRGAAWLLGYISDLIERKRADPEATGLLAELIAVADGGETILTDKDLVGIGALLLFAGHDTTAAMMGLSVMTLLSDRDRWEELGAHPEKIGGAVEELLRYLTIVQFGLGRTALEDLEIGGTKISAGDLVVVAMPIANRDPRVFSNPDTPDFDRQLTRHLAFGYGVHQCLGQNVARAELKTVLPRLIERFPTLRLAVDPTDVPMDSYGTNYGVRALPVTW
ncbi:cytochrome P450 [Brachybacterium sp. ACRRE]|uniref:cytochrome P450 n=1 Tax=Brachybacterium sp. ACRRE TaxID=2918184 RepID=UPI001EF2F381|nr:cytochrome P450 [Brachybacterium sp. ACRRE]MCG7308956.1 cytochrome P450 [Brachybacterium sp. ACRRE]